MSYYYSNADVQPYTYSSSSSGSRKSSKPKYYESATYGRENYSTSPPEQSSSRGSRASIYSATSGSSYAGSLSEEYESRSISSGSSRGVDLQDYMEDRFSNAYDPIPLDRTLAKQAQTSGMLNAKNRELMDLQAKTQARLARSKARLAEGARDAKQVREDLEWTQKRVSALKVKASSKHSREYKKARERYPSPDY